MRLTTDARDLYYLRKNAFYLLAEGFFLTLVLRMHVLWKTPLTQSSNFQDLYDIRIVIIGVTI